MSCWLPSCICHLRATYHRTHGICYFHGCYCVGDDQRRGVTREHKGAVHTLAALKSIRASRPGGYRLFVILGNLAADKAPVIAPRTSPHPQRTPATLGPPQA